MTQVISIQGTDRLIEQFEKFNQSNDVLLYFTFALFVAAVATSAVSYVLSTRQINQNKKEFLHKVRPILARHVHSKTLKNLTEPRNGDTYAISHEKALFHFINNGSTTAINVRRQSYVRIANQGFDSPTLNPRTPNDILPLADLAPTEYYSVDVNWDSSYYNTAVGGNTCRFGLLIWYDDDEGNQYYYHMEGHFDMTMLMLDYVRTGTLKPTR